MTQSARSVAAFWIAVALLLFSVGSSALPSPLFPIYAVQWNLTPLMLTGAFAIYVGGMLLALLTAGSLSDYVGRKPVLLAGTVSLVSSLVLLTIADGLVVLLIGRMLQGLAVGLLLGSLGATILDHSLVRRPALAGVLNGVIPPTALAVGALSSGVLVEWAPAPEALIYIVFAVALAFIAILLTVVPETVAKQPGVIRSLAPQLRVPPTSRRLFRNVAGALIASWALPGLYLSLVPSVLSSVFGVTNHFSSGALIALFAGCGAVTGYVLQRIDPRRQLLTGLIALAVGPVVTVSFVVAGNLAGVVLGTAIAGVGFGAGFQAALRMLLVTAAPMHRAGVLSTIYVVSYLAFGLPSVIAGLVEPFTGLVPAIIGYGLFVVLAGSAALLLQAFEGDHVEEEAAELVEESEALAR
ncbi:MFS transporter [Nocardia gipuzkoensis]